MKKKILASVLAALAVAGALTACGGSSSTPAAPSYFRATAILPLPNMSGRWL